jgi:hypothetical protein
VLESRSATYFKLLPSASKVYRHHSSFLSTTYLRLYRLGPHTFVFETNQRELNQLMGQRTWYHTWVNKDPWTTPILIRTTGYWVFIHSHNVKLLSQSHRYLNFSSKMEYQCSNHSNHGLIMVMDIFNFSWVLFPGSAFVRYFTLVFILPINGKMY